ncbi:LysM peptidoglycan-binding domain-containing protein [Novosphingobium sp. AAP1]|uniref:LysM peptidoglycan-binding domain-containing protein n=1 Tax=Novosphingobium sp. AAP1 TaxID=1523413 RepID=UPI0018D08F17|nr:LysM peptidoglycan-binding domain-containing protein [Novosphingobium sp. AAP1]
MGKGPDASVSRTYNSLTTLADDNGDDWRQSTDRRVYGLTGTLNTAGSTVRRVSGDGTEVVYTWNASWRNGTGAYVATDGSGGYDTIVKSGSEWFWFDGDTTTREVYFDDSSSTAPSGKIKSLNVPAGQTIAYTYDSNKRLSTITTSDGSWLRYDYADANGQNITQIVTGYTDLSSSTAKTLTRTRYGYDASNRLSTVTVDLSPEDSNISDGAIYVTTYGYDAVGHVTSIAQSDGSLLAIAYESVTATARVTSLTETASNGVTRTTSFAYAASTIYSGGISSAITDPSGQITVLETDVAGNLRRIIAPLIAGAGARQLTQFDYNTNGDLASVIDYAGKVTSYGNYTVDGQARTITDTLGNVVTRTFGSIDRTTGAVTLYSDATPFSTSNDGSYITNVLVSETRKGVDQSGAPIDEVTRYVYDKYGGLRYTISPEGRVTELVRSSGVVTTEVEYPEALYTAAGTTSEADLNAWRDSLPDRSSVVKVNYGYDARFNIRQITTYGSYTTTGGGQTADGSSTTLYTYDQAGQLLSKNASGYNTTTYVYDGMGRVKATADVNGGTTTYVYNDAATTTTITYASGYVVTQTYNKAGDLISQTDSGANTAGGTTSYAYDKLGRVRVRTDAVASAKTYYIYDNAGRKVGEVDNAGYVTEYRYDGVNRLIGSIHYRNATTFSLASLADPDAAVVISSVRPNTPSAQDMSSWTVYDSEDRVLQTIASDGSVTTMTYDAAGRLQKTTQFATKLSAATMSGFFANPPGAFNLVQNAAFDADTQYWSQWGMAGTTAMTAPSLVNGKMTTTFRSSSTDSWFALYHDAVQSSDIKPGQRLAVSEQIGLSGATGNIRLSVEFRDANGNFVSNVDLATFANVTNGTVNATGFVDVPANAAQMRVLAWGYPTASTLNTDLTISVSKPMVSIAGSAQAGQPAFSATPSASANDSVSRNFYDDDGLLIGTMDGEGYLTRNEYDNAGRLVATTAYANATSSANRASGSWTTLLAGVGTSAQDRVTRLVYDGRGLLRFKVDSLNQITTYQYAGNIDKPASVQVYTTALPATSDYTFDNVKRLVFGDASTTAMTAARTSYNIYDAAGRMAYSIDVSGTVTGYAYDTMGRVTRTVAYGTARVTTSQPALNTMDAWSASNISNTANRITRTFYTERGEAAYVVDGEGYVRATSYDADGRPLSTTLWNDPVTATDTTTLAGLIALLPAASSANSITTSQVYDALGRVADSYDALSNRTHYVYDANGLVLQKTSAYGTADAVTTAYTYDGMGRVLTQTAASGTGDAVTTTYTYTAFGQVATETAASNNATYAVTTRYSYDRNGRLLTKVFADSTSAAVTIAYTYTPFDEVATETVAAGTSDAVTTRYSYDALGRLVDRTAADGTSAAVTTHYTYTLFGETESETVAYGTADASVTWYTYDKLGRVLTRTGAYGMPEATTTIWTYTALGQVLTETAGDGGVTRYTYDELGRVLTRTDGYGVSGLATTTSYEYTSLGRPWKVTDGLGAITYTWYDKLGRGTTVRDALGYLTKTSYDALGNVKSVTRYDTAVSGTATQGTEPAGSGGASTTLFSYDKLGRLLSTTDALGGIESATYNLLGQKLTATSKLGAVTRYTYDKRGNLTKQVLTASTSNYSGSGNTFNAGAEIVTTFTYDQRNNRTSMAEGYAATAGGSPVSLRTTTYVFDKLDRVIKKYNAPLQIVDGALTAINDVAYTEDYSYDRRGNIIQVDKYGWDGANAKAYDKVSSFAYYDDLGQKVAEAQQSGASAWIYSTFAYDKVGHVVSTKVYENPLTVAPAQGGAAPAAPAGPWRQTDAGFDKLGHQIYTKVVSTSGNTIVSGASDGKSWLRLAMNATAAGQVASIATDDAHWTRVTAGSRLSVGAGVETTGALSDAQLMVHFRNASGNTIASVEIGTLNGVQAFDSRIEGFVDVPANAVDMRVEVYGHTSGAGAAVLKMVQPMVALATTGQNTSSSYSADISKNLLFNAGFASTSGWAIGYNPNGIASGSITAGVNSWVGVTGDLAAGQTYDANGNVVLATDANGGKVYAWYDALNRKTTQLDAEGYLTTWSYDAEGNALQETRYATKYTGTVATPGINPPSVATNAADRVTQFTYDRNGNRLTEKRLNVAAWTVNPDTGAASAASLSYSLVRYTYNALGQVVTKEMGVDEAAAIPTYDATGTAIAAYKYDNLGRLIEQKGAKYTDYLGATVQAITNYNYDALGDLVRTADLASSTPSANDRATYYRYGTGGRLLSTQDAAGNVHTYAYDALQRVRKDSYSRLTSNGTYVSEYQTTSYDLAGRTLQQEVWSAGQRISLTSYKYNSYGQITEQGQGTDSASGMAAGNALYQVKNKYDGAGRLVATNNGDGVWKFLGYDKNGNQTATVSSAGYAFGADTRLIDALAQTNRTDVNGTYVVYDKRNQATKTVEEGRQLIDTSTSNTQMITKTKSYTAFGEVASETDARGNATDYTYNTMGRVIKRELPSVNWTAENGVVSTGRPTENYYYDLGGRLVGKRDANGNANWLSLLAGTGYDKGEASIVKEFHADGGIYTRAYDAFADLRKTTNEVGMSEQYAYDKLGNLITQTHEARADGTQLIDNYAYDLNGNRLTHWNSLLGSSVKETTDYDAVGRIVKTVDLGGDATTHNYVWDGTQKTAGVGTFGGWNNFTTNAASRSNVVVEDIFGRQIDKWDFGGTDYNYVYDAAGRLASRTNNNGETINYSWYNTGLQAAITSGYMTDYYGSQATSKFKYDVDGNRTFESHAVMSKWTNWYSGVTTAETSETTYQSATVTWDAANRMTSYVDSNSTGSPANIQWEYDLTGNIRRMNSVFRYMDAQGVVSANNTAQEYWYRYDSMNRFVTTKGMLAAKKADGTVVFGNAARGVAGAVISRAVTQGMAVIFQGGMDVSYDKSGRRVGEKSTSFVRWQEDISEHRGDGYDEPIYVDHFEQEDFGEFYNYTNDGYLLSVSSDIKFGDVTEYNANFGSSGSIAIVGRYGYDLMGRTVEHYEYTGSGYNSANPNANLAYARTAQYNNKGQVTSDVVTSVRSDGRYVNSTSYYYNAAETSSGSGEWSGVTSGGTYLGGNVTKTVTTITKDGVAQTGNSTTYSYKFWDAAIQSKTNYVSGSNNWTSTFYYDTSGRLTSVYAQDGRPRTISFINDANGQVLQRDENDNQSGGDPRELHFYFNGLRVGDISNNGTSDVDYVTSIASHTATGGTGAFRGGSSSSTNYADFDQSYDPINGLTYESTSSRYTVQSGDTLEAIAQQVWGDASFWYMIADANGLSASDSLVAGQSLIIPNKVHNAHNNTSTYKVYDPNEAIGDTSPTAARPPKKNGCGVFGMILVMVVAIAVSYFSGPEIIHAAQAVLGGIASGGAVAAGSFGAIAGGVVGGAATGALASVVSQGVGLAVGAQDSFSWKGVALSALGAGISGGLGATGLFGSIAKNGFEVGKLGIKSAFADAMVRSALGSAATQGIGVATQLQVDFDWAGVAGAALGAGLSGQVKVGAFGGNVLRNMAGGLANAASRSVINGTDFGDNIVAALPDVIANTIGNLVAEKVASIGRKPGGDAPQTVIDPVTGQKVVVDAALADQINLRRYGKQIDAEIAAGVRNPDGSLRDGSGPRGLATVEDPSGRPPGDYLNPDRAETFSRSINENWRQGFEATNAAHLASVGHEYTDAPELRQAYADRDAYLVKLDAYATQMVDKPIALGLGAIVVTAATAGTGAVAAGSFGLTGWGAFGAGVVTDGLAAGNGGLFFRPMVGQQNTFRSYGKDVLIGAGTGGTFRVLGKGLSWGIGKIGSSGAIAADSVALDANAVRFSQESVSFTKIRPGGNYTYDDIVQSMSANGWKGDAIDVVRLPNGEFTTIDNTRVLAAREAGIDVQANVRAFDEQLPSNLLEQRRFGDAQTWGDALTQRINGQSSTFRTNNPYGSYSPPRITGRPGW